MKTLITGAFQYNQTQKDKMENLGLEITFMQDETKKTNIDFKKFELVICNSLFLYHDIKQFEKLKIIQLTSAGLDRVPLDYIEKNKIQLFNARGVYSIPMAEWTILKILEIYKKSKEFYKKQEKRLWEKDRNLLELNEKRVAILGFGSVGKEIAKRLKVFNTIITAVDIKPIKNENINEYYNISEIEKILPLEDIIIITLPLTDKTKGFINFKRINLMKKDAILINISRGSIINEEDLISALQEGKFQGIALDVFEEEPLNSNSKLWNFNNVVITPHNSFVGENNKERLFKLIHDNIKNIMIGEKNEKNRNN